MKDANYISNRFDLSTLDIDKLTLDMIPDFGVEEFAELKDMQCRLGTPEALGEEARLMELQFLYAADSARDMVNDGAFPEYDEGHALRALRTFARAKLEANK